MRQVAISLQIFVFKMPIKIHKLSWAEHVAANHTPFRKDCRVCQEAAAKDFYHKRSQLPPRVGVLSLDVAGPLKNAPDLSRGTAKYLLVGTFTWPARNQDGEEEEEQKLGGEDEVPAEGPEIEDPEAIEDGIFDDEDEPPPLAPLPEVEEGQEKEKMEEEAPLPEE